MSKKDSSQGKKKVDRTTKVDVDLLDPELKAALQEMAWEYPGVDGKISRMIRVISQAAVEKRRRAKKKAGGG